MTRQTRWRRLVDNVLRAYLLGDKLSSTDLESEEIWRDYYFMMECFFDKIQEIYTPGDLIMVHDYHLMMLPRLLRRRLPDAHVTFSMHTPCRRILEMPGRLGEFIEGILGSNFTTFLEPQNAVHFGSWCAQNSSDRPSYWATRAMDSCSSVPMGIDVSGIISVAQSEEVSERCEALRRALKNRRLVLSYGTLDSEMEMREVRGGYSRMIEQAPWWRESVILLQVVCTSRAHDPHKEEYSIFDYFTVSGESANSISSILCQSFVSELDFHALARCSDAAIFSFVPGGPMTAALEYFVCQSRGKKRPIVSDANPIVYQALGLIQYRLGDYDSIAWAIDYTLRLPGGHWTGIPQTPRLEDYDVDIFNTAEGWTKIVLRDLMEKLLRDCRPAGTSDTDVRGSRSPEEFARAEDADEELSGGDGSLIGDGGGDSMGSYDDCGEGVDDEDFEDEKWEKRESDGEEDEGGEEGGTELERSEDGEVTPVERIRTRSVEFERMGSFREAWARKTPATV